MSHIWTSLQYSTVSNHLPKLDMADTEWRRCAFIPPHLPDNMYCFISSELPIACRASTSPVSRLAGHFVDFPDRSNLLSGGVPATTPTLLVFQFHGDAECGVRRAA